MNVIQRVIASVYDETGQLDKDVFDNGQLLIKRTVTVLGYGVLLVGNKLKLVKQNQGVKNNVIDASTDMYGATDIPWRSLVNEYGTLSNGTSQLRLELATGAELIGTVAYDPTDDTQLLFNVLVDTVPVNTLPAINAIIDPNKSNVIDLLYNTNGTYKVTSGTRYLILDDIGSITNTDFAKAWTPNGIPVVAKANDIIQYDGNRWFVSFDSNGTTAKKDQYVTNTNTGVQYRWDGDQWVKSYEGLYRESAWRIIL
jgi:hypothetical protein